MNILVLVKQVPNTTEIKINKETGTLIRDGVESIINPDDLAGVTEAIKLRNEYGGTVTTVTMGPAGAKGMIRELFGYGVDDAVLVSDRVFAGSDTLATSTILSEAIKTKKYDLIIAGRQAIDGDTAQVGPQIAELLNINQVTYVEKINKVTKKAITVTKQLEDFNQEIECAFPCLITTLNEMNTPKYQDVTNLWNGFDKEITLLTNEDLKIDKSVIGLKGSPTKVKKTFTKPVQKKTEKQKLSPKDAADLIIKSLSEYM